jgi:hypothetical protein
MRPFDVSPALEGLREVYPPADEFLVAAREGDREARYAIAQLWLSEGIPHSFKARPALYESLRRWVARRLDVQGKEVTIIGSGRQGFSLSPGANLRRAFGAHSDLDLSVVSHSLFRRLEAAFVRWDADYTAGSVAARSERERTLWEANEKSVPSGLARGFIDPHKIPTLARYPEAQMIGQVMYEAHEKLKISRDAPAVRKVSVRVYRDWDSFVRQLAINLQRAATTPLENRVG